ncbi:MULTISPECIES: hypothetical protein [Serratia]|uniref:hypothetical protein n=1 Tax=Serratia TaxID=613 RepID=UPI001184E089|nr:hypothetical protein [Serratia marcescens]MDV5745423.1 hypothetical protein [Serratia marcescens]MDV5750334.1 hypothetical protein [Serratia marcescens]MDV5781772.1 hypothetical protein [Serratia marcescens]MDV5786714.1 hypothetical protein [Serratia marcescens]MDV5833612.1 hypothetical protein [Serratia marcescens]
MQMSFLIMSAAPFNPIHPEVSIPKYFGPFSFTYTRRRNFMEKRACSFASAILLYGGEAWPRYFSDNARHNKSPVRLPGSSPSIPNISRPTPELQMPTRDAPPFSRYFVVKYLTEAKHLSHSRRTPTLALVKYPDNGFVGLFIVIIAICSIAQNICFYKKENIITHSDIWYQ